MAFLGGYFFLENIKRNLYFSLIKYGPTPQDTQCYKTRVLRIFVWRLQQVEIKEIFKTKQKNTIISL